jgi:hypothetical protein
MTIKLKTLIKEYYDLKYQEMKILFNDNGIVTDVLAEICKYLSIYSMGSIYFHYSPYDKKEFSDYLDCSLSSYDVDWQEVLPFSPLETKTNLVSLYKYQNYLIIFEHSMMHCVKRDKLSYLSFYSEVIKFHD